MLPGAPPSCSMAPQWPSDLKGTAAAVEAALPDHRTHSIGPGRWGAQTR